MFETKEDYNETEMRTLIELLYGSIAIKEQALSSKIYLWEYLQLHKSMVKSAGNWLTCKHHLQCKIAFEASVMLLILRWSLVVTVKSLETCADWRQRRCEQCSSVWRLCWRQTPLTILGHTGTVERQHLGEP